MNCLKILFKTTMRENERMSALRKKSVAKQSLHCNWTKVKSALMVPFSNFCAIRIFNWWMSALGKYFIAREHLAKCCRQKTFSTHPTGTTSVWGIQDEAKPGMRCPETMPGFAMESFCFCWKHALHVGFVGPKSFRQQENQSSALPFWLGCRIS